MRKSWYEYFMEMAELVSERATCKRLKVGCILVKDNRVISSGYNGSVSGMPHCIDEGCDMQDGHCVRCNHAEINALLQCAKYGISTEGTTAYITHYPCLACARALAQAGIKHVYYLHKYRNDERVEELFNQLNITCN